MIDRIDRLSDRINRSSDRINRLTDNINQLIMGMGIGSLQVRWSVVNGVDWLVVCDAFADVFAVGGADVGGAEVGGVEVAADVLPAVCA